MNCTRCETPVETGDLRCAVCALVLAELAPAADAVRAAVLRCTDCGAAIAFSAEKQAPHCAFCGAVMKVEQPVDPVERAELVVPFAVTHDEAVHALRHWLGRRGWFYPRDLAANARLADLAPLHWAAWVVDARAIVSWAADSDYDSHRSRWAPHAGQTPMDFDNICVPASRGLTLRECITLSSYYDLSTARPISAEDESSDPIEQFDAQRSAARKTVLGAIESTAAARLQRGVIPGSRFRKVKVSVFLQALTTRRIALPAWVLVYRYRDRTYRAVIHGQNPAGVVAKAPLAWSKVGLVVALAAVVIAVIVAVIATR